MTPGGTCTLERRWRVGAEEDRLASLAMYEFEGSPTAGLMGNRRSRKLQYV